MEEQNIRLRIISPEEAARVDTLANSWKDARDRADEYYTIARNLKKEARKLQRQAAQCLKDAAADRKRAKSCYAQMCRDKKHAGTK